MLLALSNTELTPRVWLLSREPALRFRLCGTSAFFIYYVLVVLVSRETVMRDWRLFEGFIYFSLMSVTRCYGNLLAAMSSQSRVEVFIVQISGVI